MPDAVELLKEIKKAAMETVEASAPMCILFGRVTKTEPLEIEADQKLKLGRAQLILSRNVTDFETEVSVETCTEKALGTHSHQISAGLEEAGEPLHTHTIFGSTEQKNLEHAHEIKRRMKVTIHNRLAVGDRVILLQDKGGQGFLVVDRVE